MNLLSGPAVSSYATQYATILSALLSPQMPREVNKRTGVGISFCPAGAILSTRVGPALPLIDLRRTRPRTAAAEVEWFVSGEKSLRVLHELDVHIWDQFQDVDGSIETAYGWRWRRRFKRDQLTVALNTLTSDPTNRRVVVSAWDPSVDGMETPQLATPCPVAFTLSTSEVSGPRKNRELNSTLWIRSSDVFVGLPYDVMGHAILMGLIARELRLELGWLTVSLAHPHLYDVHRDMARIALAGVRACPYVQIATAPLSSVQHAGEAGHLANYYENAAEATKWPSYDPKPEVVK